MRSRLPGIAAPGIGKDVTSLHSVHLKPLDRVLDITPAGVELVSERLNMQVVDDKNAEIGKALDHVVGIAVERFILEDVLLERIG